MLVLRREPGQSVSAVHRDGDAAEVVVVAIGPTSASLALGGHHARVVLGCWAGMRHPSGDVLMVRVSGMGRRRGTPWVNLAFHDPARNFALHRAEPGEPSRAR